jgi:hypothetical protein
MLMPTTRCRHIFCKGMGIFGDDYRTPVDDLDRTNDFWCQQTLNVLGPDNGLVMLSRCTAERSCHEPL